MTVQKTYHKLTQTLIPKPSSSNQHCSSLRLPKLLRASIPVLPSRNLPRNIQKNMGRQGERKNKRLPIRSRARTEEAHTRLGRSSWTFHQAAPSLDRFAVKAGGSAKLSRLPPDIPKPLTDKPRLPTHADWQTMKLRRNTGRRIVESEQEKFASLGS